MTVKINANDIGGELSILPSKSFAHRQLICAALSDNPCEIICNAASKDIEATVRCLRALGAEIEETDGIYKITPIKKAESGELFCGESGSTLRFLIPVASALGGFEFGLCTTLTSLSASICISSSSSQRQCAMTRFGLKTPSLLR